MKANLFAAENVNVNQEQLPVIRRNVFEYQTEELGPSNLNCFKNFIFKLNEQFLVQEIV